MFAASLLCGRAQALGLGEVQVHSRLGAPLRATVSITGVVSAKEDLSITLRFPDDLEPFGLSSGAISARVNETRDRVDLKSSVSVTEPLLGLILTARSRSAATVEREYTLVLDPPNYSAYRQESLPNVAASKSTTTKQMRVHSQDGTATAQNKLGVPAPQSIALKAGEYKVRWGDTLWGLGTELARGTSVAGSQIAVALYRKNPHVFENGDVNAMRMDSSLELPTLEEAKLLTAREARAMLRGGKSSLPQRSEARSVSGALAKATESATSTGILAQGLSAELAPIRNASGMTDQSEAGQSVAGGNYQLKLSSIDAASRFDAEMLAQDPHGSVMIDELARIEAMIRDREQQTSRIRERLRLLDEQIAALLELAKKQAALALRLDHELRELAARSDSSFSPQPSVSSPPQPSATISGPG